MLIILALLFLAITTIVMIIRAQDKAFEERWMALVAAKHAFRNSLESVEEVLTYDIYEALVDVRSAAASLNYRIGNLFGG